MRQFPAGQIGEANVSNSRSNQVGHPIIECFKHSANLPIDTLAQDHSQFGRRNRTKLCQLRSFAIEKYSAQQLRRERRVPLSIECHFVFFFDFVTRMNDALSEVAIVRQNEQAFALSVETADVEQTRKFA